MIHRVQFSSVSKGNVKRKVAYNRRNLFVPVPSYEDVCDFNRELLGRHLTKAAELHYKKEVPIGELFEQDSKALLPLPAKPFDVCRYERQITDGYGKVVLNSKHRYSTRPELAKQEVVLEIRAHTVEVQDSANQPVVTHRRSFSGRRTDTLDHSTSLAQLMRNPGAWRNSGLREELPAVIRQELDGRDRAGLREALKLMSRLKVDFGFVVAVAAMEEAAGRGHLNVSDTTVLASRIAGFGLTSDPDPGPDLAAYDRAFLAFEEVLA